MDRLDSNGPARQIKTSRRALTGRVVLSGEGFGTKVLTEKGLSDAAKREYWSMQDAQRWAGH